MIPFATVPLQLPLLKDDHDVAMLWGACLCHLRSLCRGKCWTVATGGKLRITVLWPVHAVPWPMYPIQTSFETPVFDRGSRNQPRLSLRAGDYTVTISYLYFEFWYLAQGYVDLSVTLDHGWSMFWSMFIWIVFFKSLGDEMSVPSFRVGYWCLEWWLVIYSPQWCERGTFIANPACRTHCHSWQLLLPGSSHMIATSHHPKPFSR